jgi:hypothetical protein
MKIHAEKAAEIGEALLDAAQDANAMNVPCLVIYNENLQIAYTSTECTTVVDDTVLYTVHPA